MRSFWLVFFLLIVKALPGIDINRLQEALTRKPHSFSYALDIKIAAGTQVNEDVVLCCPGYGGDSSLAAIVSSHNIISQHLVSFNFPDYDILKRGFNRSTSTFGSIDELLPALFVLKRIVIDAGATRISLYGFSAGGGAVVNLIAVLNSRKYEDRLLKIGINSQNKSKILSALQEGVILLDAPLKTIEEIIESKGSDAELDYMASCYLRNHMRPIDALTNWQGLNLSVVLFFQDPDESLSNRDDQLFAQRLRQVNPHGRNIVIIANEGGHCGFHQSLWTAYKDLAINRS